MDNWFKVAFGSGLENYLFLIPITIVLAFIVSFVFGVVSLFQKRILRGVIFVSIPVMCVLVVVLLAVVATETDFNVTEKDRLIEAGKYVLKYDGTKHLLECVRKVDKASLWTQKIRVKGELETEVEKGIIKIYRGYFYMSHSEVEIVAFPTIMLIDIPSGKVLVDRELKKFNEYRIASTDFDGKKVYIYTCRFDGKEYLREDVRQYVLSLDGKLELENGTVGNIKK